MLLKSAYMLSSMFNAVSPRALIGLADKSQAPLYKAWVYSLKNWSSSPSVEQRFWLLVDQGTAIASAATASFCLIPTLTFQVERGASRLKAKPET